MHLENQSHCICSFVHQNKEGEKKNIGFLDNFQVVRAAGVVRKRNSMFQMVLQETVLIPAKQGMDSLCYHDLYSCLIHTLQR